MTKMLKIQRKQPAAPVTPLRMFAAFCMLAVAVCILAFGTSTDVAANRDFIQYWPAGQQLVHHSNPYGADATLRLQRCAGFKETTPQITRVPPSALFLALPLGYVGERTGSAIWSFAILAALMGSIRLIWIEHGRPEGRLHLLGYLFPPSLACLLAGQIGAFILVGVVLFLYFQESKPYWAGAALLLCATKPHLFLPFGAGLLAWIIVEKAYKVFVGAFGAFVASCALTFCFDRAAWSHWIFMTRAAGLDKEFVPTVSMLFRLGINPREMWLQFIPAAAASVWALWYFWTHRKAWNWKREGLLLLTVSITFAPYAWLTDETALLPVIFAGLYALESAGRSLVPFGCIACVALIEVLAGVTMPSGYYVWTAPAWLAWYLYTSHILNRPPGSVVVAAQ